MHFLRTGKCLLRGFRTIHCLLMKCLPLEDQDCYGVQLQVHYIEVPESIAFITCITQVTMNFFKLHIVG